jgi:hypothetical protein
MSGGELELRDDTLDDIATLIDESPTIVLPFIGEAIDLHNLDEVASGLEQVRELKRRLDEVRGLFENVIRLRSREVGTKTLHLGSVDAVVSGGSRPEYDVELLAEALRAAGCPEQRIDELIVATITYRVDQRVARQLAGANPAYGAALAEARRDVPAAWRVAIKRRR